MSDWIWFDVKWLMVGTALSPIVFAVGWVIVEGAILPRFLSRAEIETMADIVMRDHPNNAEEWAFMEEHAAWCRSRNFEQGKWNRVRKTIRKRLLAADLQLDVGVSTSPPMEACSDVTFRTTPSGTVHIKE